MGDFDKNQTPNTNAEKKKLVFVGILGTILLGVVGFHFMKGGAPQSASASTLSVDATPAVAASSLETPAEARAALANDPTASLLRGTSNPDASYEKAPHNPFVIAAEWGRTLVRVVPVKTLTHTVEPVVIAATPQAVVLDAYKLTGIFQQDKALCAIINGRLLSVGMTLDDVKIVDITHDHVTLQRVDSPTGPKADLTISSKL